MKYRSKFKTLDAVNEMLKTEEGKKLSWEEACVLKAIVGKCKPGKRAVSLTEDELTQAVNEVMFEEVMEQIRKIGKKTGMSEQKMRCILAMQFEYFDQDIVKVYETVKELADSLKEMDGDTFRLIAEQINAKLRTS